MTDPAQLSRRRLLGLAGAGAAGVLAGGIVTWRINQSDNAGGQVLTPATTTSAPGTPPDTQSLETTTTDTTEPPPLQTERYVPVAGEVFVDAKLAGVRAVEELMSYDVGDDPRSVVERVLRDGIDGLRPDDVRGAAEALFVPQVTSTVEVVYPQLGGLDPHRDPRTASIMVVVVQRLGSASGVDRVSRCIDVRVRKVGDDWRFDELADTSGTAVPRSSGLSDEALRVLEHDDIAMPDSVRWDIHEGIVDRRILAEMADLADQTPIGVTTCMRGHPINVFGTPNRSAHSVGRAVDIWAVGDRPVVQQRDDESSVAYQVAEALFEARRVHRLGAPWAFDGAGGRSWTDPVHLDHLHLGVSA
jgi:hypothetical protein